MNQASSWPLGPEGIRFFVPKFVAQEMSQHPLGEDLYPLAFGYYPLARGHQMSRAQHLDHLMIYCVHGSGSLHVDGEHFIIQAGDLIFLPPGQSHHYESSSTEPWTIYWCHFDGKRRDDYFNFAFANEHRGQTERTGRRFVLSIGIHPKLIGDFELLLEARQSGYKRDRFLHISCHLRQMMSYIGLLSPKVLVQTGNPLDLDAIHAFMMENIHQQLDLMSVAALSNLSKYHFSKKYKRLTGQSPIQHFIHLKMEHACYLLDISDKPIGSISQMLSYEDPHYFSRLFKKIVGVSPKEYRLLKRG